MSAKAEPRNALWICSPTEIPQKYVQNTCSRIFMAALFVTAKKLETTQNVPSTTARIDKMLHSYNTQQWEWTISTGSFKIDEFPKTFLLYEVQKQAKLICTVRSKDSGYPRERIVTRGRGADLVLFLIWMLNTRYSGEFCHIWAVLFQLG